MAVNLSPVGGVAGQFFDNNGDPLSGGKIYTYTAGTTTPQTTYTSATGTTPHANPIILDAAGRVPGGEIWLTDSLQYKFVIQTSNNVLIGTYDNIIGINSNFLNYTNSQEIQTATAGQTVFTLTTMQYQPGTNSLSVFVDGVNQYGPGASYAYQETSSTVVTFTSGLHVGAEVKFTTSVINASSYGDAEQISYTPPYTGGVTTNVEAKLAQTVSAADFGIVSNGITDQTTALINVLNALSLSGFRGWVDVAYNTKFNVSTVYAAVPTGIVLNDQSSINWGQPPGYKNKFNTMFSGDTVSDDTQQVIGSNHHPSLMFLNTGTAVSASATSRYASILQAVGIDYNNDPVLGFLQQFNKQAGNPRWQVQWRLQTPYSIAIANPQPWVTATVYAANAYCISDSGKVYQTTAGGTSGGTAPTGTGTGINDGGVLWNYVQAALNIDATVFYFDEDGNCQIIARSGSPQFRQQSGVKYHYFEVSSTTGDITWRDGSRSLNVLSVTDAAGLELGIAQGPNRLILSGTGPNAPVNGYGRIDNASPTSMSTMVPPVGRNRMIVSLRFENANTTVVHGTGTNNFTLKGSTNANPPTGGFMSFEYDTSFSARWFEVSRSF